MLVHLTSLSSPLAQQPTGQSTRTSSPTALSSGIGNHTAQLVTTSAPAIISTRSMTTPIPSNVDSTSPIISSLTATTTYLLQELCNLHQPYLDYLTESQAFLFLAHSQQMLPFKFTKNRNLGKIMP